MCWAPGCVMAASPVECGKFWPSTIPLSPPLIVLSGGLLAARRGHLSPPAKYLQHRTLDAQWRGFGSDTKNGREILLCIFMASAHDLWTSCVVRSCLQFFVCFGFSRPPCTGRPEYVALRAALVLWACCCSGVQPCLLPPFVVRSALGVAPCLCHRLW